MGFLFNFAGAIRVACLTFREIADENLMKKTEDNFIATEPPGIFR
jgi:hypothetical protein